MKRFFALLLTALLLGGSLIGCEKAGKENDLAPYPVRVASVTITQTPEKVVCFSPSLTELSHALGYGSRLVGKTEDATYPEAVSSLPTVGKTGNIDVKALLALQPDTVLSHQSLSKKEMDILEKAKIKVVVLPMANSLEGVKQLYEQLGLLYAGQLDGKSIAQKEYQKITDGLKQIQTILPPEDFKNGFAYIIHPTNGIVATGDTLESSLLSTVFGKNAAESGTDYTIEATVLAEKNPSLILTADPYGLPHLESNKNYKDLAAAKAKKVATINSKLLASQSVRMVEGVKEVAKALYPDLFTEETSSEPTSSQAVSSTQNSFK